jgi:hypothetical protein
MKRRWPKQQGRRPETFQERPSGKGVIVCCVTRHPDGVPCSRNRITNAARAILRGALRRLASVDSQL